MPTSSCATVLCPPSKTCVDTVDGAQCVCSVHALCIQGYTWDSSTCQCVPSSAECRSDSDCHLEDNYCGGCNCLALAPGESGPTCSNPVSCFASPCAVTSGTAACVDGQCVLSNPTL
jgi:hypothetical protein